MAEWISERAECSRFAVSNIIAGRRKPSASLALRLYKASGVHPMSWLYPKNIIIHLSEKPNHHSGGLAFFIGDKMNYFSWSVAVASLIATIANIHKKKWCFWIWAFTNASWTGIDLYFGIYAQALLQAIYCGLAVWGLPNGNDIKLSGIHKIKKNRL